MCDRFGAPGESSRDDRTGIRCQVGPDEDDRKRGRECNSIRARTPNDYLSAARAAASTSRVNLVLLLVRSHLARLGGLISGVRLHSLRIQTRSRLIPALKKPRECLSCSESPEPWEIDMEGISRWVMWAKPYRRVILRHPRIQDVGPRSSLNLDRFLGTTKPRALAQWLRLLD